MLYMTVKEAAAKWGLGTRVVTLYCEEKKIQGALKRGNLWLIPEYAERPTDKRRREQLPSRPSLSDDLARLITSMGDAIVFHDTEVVSDSADDERIQIEYEAETSYLRGDFQKAVDCFEKTRGDDAARLCICLTAIAATISLGDYRMYTEIEDYLKKCINANKGSGAAAMAELALATAAVSVIAPTMAPDWLKDGDFGVLVPEAWPQALYLRAKYFVCLRRYDAGLAVAETALTLTAQPRGFTTMDIYQRLTCATACHCLGRDDEARRWLLEAMRLALPHGFVTPFAELITALGGLVEQCLQREFPAYYGPVLEQWKHTWKNWIEFHNQFTSDNITVILTPREYHLALLVAQHVPYDKIAKQYCISVGRLKNIMSEIYQKLQISSREELTKYII